MKHFFTLLAFNLIISTFYTIIQDFVQFSFINCFFIIGIVYFLFGLLCFVWQKGFFDITIFSFNKLSQQIQGKKGVLTEETNLTLDDYLCRSNHFYLTNSLLLCGGVVSLISIVISFMYI